MRHLRSGLRPAFALFVIAHGLAHAVLPMRGWMNPETLGKDFVPVILYGVAVLGYAIAGLGVLGIRPFAAAARPLMVIAPVYSLVALWRMGHGDLWWGAAVDVALFLVGVTGAYQRLPAPAAHRGPVRRALGVVAASRSWLMRPARRCCGRCTGPGDRTRPNTRIALPGDAPNRNAALEIQHAVTVNAPPEAVWPWLVQLGQDRAGFYSYDWLERAFGVDVHNVTEVRPEWQHREVGDRVRATQAGYLGGVLGRDLGWTVDEIQPGRAIVLSQWGAFVLLPAEHGKTRFIIRTRIGNEHTPAWAAALDVMTFELPHFIMERKMMLQIKALAEEG